ncbi:MAG TPA: hypothetical protein VFX49_17445, partial [Chloroflexota bacterium]|nr:hypothetical protein [Chloroflexota bacterium]
MATNVRYRLISARGIGWPLVIAAAAAAALPFFSGLPLPSFPRPGARPNPAPGIERFSQEVAVPNVARGCRWQYTNQADVQIADCGDDSETVRVVFERGKVTEYRVIARQDPTKLPPGAPPGGVAGITTTQPSQSGSAS